MSFELKRYIDSKIHFMAFARPIIETRLGGEIICLEEQDGIGKFFDVNTVSDYAISQLQLKGCTYTLASRFQYFGPEDNNDVTFHFTIRVKTDENYDSEWTKLVRSYKELKQGINSIFPRWLFKGRILYDGYGVPTLKDYGIIEIIQLFRFLEEKKVLDANNENSPCIEEDSNDLKIINRSDTSGQFICISKELLKNNNIEFLE